jgi:hypothetical protein
MKQVKKKKYYIILIRSVNESPFFLLELSGSVVLTVILYYLLGNQLASQCLFISHQVAPNQYGKGFGDVYFVLFWTVVFTFVRAAFIKYFYLPLSDYFSIGDPSKRQRVAEQFYILAYYVTFGSAGLVSLFTADQTIKLINSLLCCSTSCTIVHIGLIQLNSGLITLML